MKKSAEPLNEAITHLRTMRDTWKEVMRMAGKQFDRLLAVNYNDLQDVSRMIEKNYLDILIESLQKKVRLLGELIEKNEQQAKLLDAVKFDDEAFDSIMDEKAALITQLRFLDTGFEAVYERARETLMKNRVQYASKIKDMQTLITVITQRSTAIEASERRNDLKFKNRFRSEHQKVRQSKNSVQAVTGYYKSMAGGGGTPGPRYMDTKY